MQRQREDERAWLKRHPAYPVQRRMRLRELRAAKGHPVDPLEMQAPLAKLPWDVAQKQFGVQGAAFRGHAGGSWSFTAPAASTGVVPILINRWRGRLCAGA